MIHILRALAKTIDDGLGRVCAVAQWLVLPIALLLLLQWPLREVFARFSREANDLGQVCFAVFVSVAMTAAMRAEAHLHTDVISRRYPRHVVRWLAALGLMLALIPWSAFMLFAHFDSMRRSLMGLEAFPETVNFGYFIIKLAAWFSALLLLLQTLVELVRLRQSGTR